ncbi:MAG: transposase [Spirochaetes bacterium]|jgi:hypothetical protein|nr:transposase [Spirochaetota bacterium]
MITTWSRGWLRRCFERIAHEQNAYLGLVPRCHDSGGKSRPGHISRESRKLSRTILTQSIYQTIKATPEWERDYEALKARPGSGRGRIAMIRRLSGDMRRMLLQGEQFHWWKEELYPRKHNNRLFASSDQIQYVIRTGGSA